MTKLRKIAVMDTTLRDGEQTPDVSYTPAEKLHLARLLLEGAKVDRIEIASTRVSKGESEAARRITSWAKKHEKLSAIEILGYCDGQASVDWIQQAGGKVMNLLTKGSEQHCREQLRISPDTHFKRIAESVRYARRKRISVNVYLEDWSQGVRNSFDYVFRLVKHLSTLPIERIYLPDTLGILSPDDTHRYVELMASTWPTLQFEFHAHNDYGLATANCLAAVQAGAVGVHTSVNGMGERAGNTKLAEIVSVLHDQSTYRTQVDESRLADLSRVVETFSGKDLAANSPIVGKDVFTQTAGIHADGDAKGDLYASKLAPARFGRTRRYALGKLSGKASLDHNLKQLGIELSETNRELVLQRIIELGDKKHTVVPEDLPYIVADVLKAPDEHRVRVESYEVNLGSSLEPNASVNLSFHGEQVEASASGDGGYDAFMNALKKTAKHFGFRVPKLEDFRVRIPPGGRTGALVETLITWEAIHKDESSFSTLGVDSDQMAAAVIATEKMLNLLAARQETKRGKKSKTKRKPR